MKCKALIICLFYYDYIFFYNILLFINFSHIHRIGSENTCTSVYIFSRIYNFSEKYIGDAHEISNLIFSFFQKENGVMSASICGHFKL